MNPDALEMHGHPNRSLLRHDITRPSWGYYKRGLPEK
jgi:hypothetical protein